LFVHLRGIYFDIKILVIIVRTFQQQSRKLPVLVTSVGPILSLTVKNSAYTWILALHCSTDVQSGLRGPGRSTCSVDPRFFIARRDAYA